MFPNDGRKKTIVVDLQALVVSVKEVKGQKVIQLDDLAAVPDCAAQHHAEDHPDNLRRSDRNRVVFFFTIKNGRCMENCLLLCWEN